jgi:hypothetical protein
MVALGCSGVWDNQAPKAAASKCEQKQQGLGPTPSESMVKNFASWADASVWEEASTQSGSSPRHAAGSKGEGACGEEADGAPLGQEPAAKRGRRSHRQRRRHRNSMLLGESEMAQVQNRAPPSVVTLGDLGFDLGPTGTFGGDAIATVSIPAPSATLVAVASTCKQPESEYGWEPVPSPCRPTRASGGVARPHPVPLSTGLSTLSEAYTTTTPGGSDASSRRAVAPVGAPVTSPAGILPWGGPPGNLTPVHRPSPLALRAPSLQIEVCPTATAPNKSATPAQSPGIMSTQPISQPQQSSDWANSSEGASPKKSPTPWGGPPGNLTPVHRTSPLALRAPASLQLDVCPTATAAATAPAESPTKCRGIMSTQPIPQPQVSSDPAEFADGASPKKSPVAPAWSPAGTPQADVLRSWLQASGLQVQADHLADQLRAAAPEIYED